MRYLLFLLLLSSALPAWAQEAVRFDGLRAEARAAAERGASVLELPTRRAADLRVDARTGVVRGDYDPPAFAPPGSDAEAQARSYLSRFAGRYGFAADLSDLRVARVIRGRYDQHIVFRQIVEVEGEVLPVFGREIQVSMTPSGRVLMVQSGYEPVAQATSGVWDDATARRRAAALVDGGGRVAELARIVMPRAEGHQAQRAYLAIVAGAEEWALVIGLDGAVLFAAARTVHHGGSGRAHAPTFGLAERAPVGPMAVRADGSGLGFDPDPLTTAGASYGGAYVDDNDADTPELDAQRVELALPGITQRNGLWRLEGPYVVVDGTLGATYAPPSETNPDAFRYTRSDDRFEAVMVYHHIDADQRRAQALDVGRPILEQPIRVNPQGDLSDNSRFFTNNLTIRMGVGGVDDAEDAMVIRHEYAHALLNADAPSLYQRQDGSALHEGWADYWAASWRASLIEAGQGSGDVRDVFPWDGNNGCWQGRRLDHPGSYPNQAVYPAPTDGCSNFPTIYQRGLLWATTLFDLRETLGGPLMDRLVVASHAFVGNVPGVPAFESAAQALLAADDALYDGRNRRTLALGLSARGYVDASSAGPDLVHAGLRSTEQSGGTRRVAALVRPTGASARLVYQVDGGADQTLTLARIASSDSVAVDLPIPVGPAMITYFLDCDRPGGTHDAATGRGSVRVSVRPRPLAADARSPPARHLARSGVARPPERRRDGCAGRGERPDPVCVYVGWADAARRRSADGARGSRPISSPVAR